MKYAFLRGRYLLAILAGLLWTGAFPKIGIAGFAWLAPGLIVAAALGKMRGEAFRIGYLAGLTHYLTMLYWLLLIPYRWHGIPFGPALGWLALGGFLALFPAVWVALVSGPSSSVEPSRQTTQEPPGFGPSAVIPWVENWGARDHGVLASNWVRRASWALCAAAGWVGWEMVLARVFGGFPWDLLGVSQYRLLPLLQIATLTGVYGVSFLVTWTSLALLSAGLMVIRRPTARSVWIGEIFIPILVVSICFNIGFRLLRNQPESERRIKVALVQPSIPQALIWDPSADSERFHQLVQLSERALSERQVDLMLWPEAALPKKLRYDKETFEAITNLAVSHHTWLIIGSDDAEPRPDATNPEDAVYFNSSFLINPEGHILERYIKRNLVIFGEYVPFQRWLPFLKYLTPIEGGFTPGTRAVPFKLEPLHLKTQVLICFEDVFPHLAREDVDPDTDFLVNLTNDGWFGEGAAQWQQAATGLFRAIENRIPLLRCANNGLTCWVDSCGRFRQIFRDERGSVYGAGVMQADIPLLSDDTRHPLTFYTRHGDWFGWSSFGLSLIWAVKNAFQPLKTRLVRNRL